MEFGRYGAPRLELCRNIDINNHHAYLMASSHASSSQFETQGPARAVALRGVDHPDAPTSATVTFQSHADAVKSVANERLAQPWRALLQILSCSSTCSDYVCAVLVL